MKQKNSNQEAQSATSGKSRKPVGGVNKYRRYGGNARNKSSNHVPKHNSTNRTELVVDNLSIGLNDSDVYEIFREFGPLKSARVRYDRSGRSLGSADVVFKNGIDAMKAMKQFSGAQLDDRETHIQTERSAIPSSSRVSVFDRLGGIFKARHTNRGQATRAGSATYRRHDSSNKRHSTGTSKSGHRHQRKRQITAKQLDAELDAYFQQVVKF